MIVDSRLDDFLKPIAYNLIYTSAWACIVEGVSKKGYTRMKLTVL